MELMELHQILGEFATDLIQNSTKLEALLHSFDRFSFGHISKLRSCPFDQQIMLEIQPNPNRFCLRTQKPLKLANFVLVDVNRPFCRRVWKDAFQFRVGRMHDHTPSASSQSKSKVTYLPTGGTGKRRYAVFRFTASPNRTKSSRMGNRRV
jgi:hypothetical protein